MEDVTTRIAERRDVTRLNTALTRLSEDIGDRHAATDDQLEHAGFGPAPAFRAVIAERDDKIVGLAMYSPMFSTIRASAGIHITDLWVDADARGLGLGRRLLLAASADGAEIWGAGFMKLVVYEDNPSARGFYRKLGFTFNAEEVLLTLDAEGLAALKEET